MSTSGRVQVLQMNDTVSEVESMYRQAFDLLQPLLGKNPSISSAKLESLYSRLGDLSRSNVTVQIGDDLFTGICRYALAASKGNLVLARAILHGPNGASHIARISFLSAKAKNTLTALIGLLGQVRTARDWLGTSGRSAIAIHGLGDPASGGLLIAAAAIVTVVVFAIAVTAIFYMFRLAYSSQQATRTVLAACEGASPPCTPDDIIRLRAEAVRQQNEISPPMEPGSDPLSMVGDLVFWGGMAAVVFGLGYTALVTYPAAKRLRGQFESD